MQTAAAIDDDDGVIELLRDPEVFDPDAEMEPAYALLLEEQAEQSLCTLPQYPWDLPQTVHERGVLGQALSELMEDLEANGTPQSQKSQIWNAARQLNNLRRLVELLTSSKGDLFRVDMETWGYVVRCYRPLGHRLRIVLATTDRRLKEVFPLCELEPHVDAFLQCFDDLLGERMVDQFTTYAAAEAMAVRLNRGVQCLRDQVASPEFVQTLSSLKRSLSKNRQRLRSFIDGLFNRHSKLLVVRVDLTYRNAGKIATEDVAIREVERAQRDREAFFHAARRLAIWDNVVGHVWKMEYGLHRGPHLHLLVFFDGQKARQDGSLARTLGELWIRVTQERGDFYNCNANKARYGDALGIGMIERGDAVKRARLQVAARYLVEVDLVRRLRLPQAYRALAIVGRSRH